MAEKTLPEMTDELATLMRERLGVRRGQGLEAKLHRGGRLLPRKLRAEAARLVEQSKQIGSPKLLKMINQAEAAQSYHKIKAHLEAIDPKERAKDRWLSIASGLALNFLVIFAAGVTWAVWTGRL